MSSSLLPINSCSHCFAEPGTVLRCSRCSAATYCDKKCQSDAFPSHKKHCKKIGENLKIIKERLKQPGLKHFLCYDVPEKGHVNLDSEHMTATIALSEHYHQMGQEEHGRAALEKGLNYRLSALKQHLYQSDTTQLYDGIDEFEWDILFNYIALDRIQDAHDFIIMWIYPDYWAIAGKPFTPNRYQNITYFLIWEKKQYIPGDPTQEIITHGEVFRNCEGPLGLFCAIVLIKAKVLIQISRQREMNQFLLGTDLELGQKSPVFRIKNMEPVISKIKQYVVGPKPKFLEEKVLEDVEQSVAEILVKNLHMLNFIDPHALYALTGDDGVKTSSSFDKFGKRAMIAAKLAKPIFRELENLDRVLMLAKQVKENLVGDIARKQLQAMIAQIATSYRTGVPVAKRCISPPIHWVDPVALLHKHHATGSTKIDRLIDRLATGESVAIKDVLLEK